MDWKTLPAYITGSVDEELLLRNEYLATENRILRAQIKGRLRAERWRAQDARGDRREARSKGPHRSREHRETGDHPVVASQAGREEVRGIEEPRVSGSPTNR